MQFLDADDLIEREKFSKQVEYLETHPEVDIVYGDVRYFRTENRNEEITLWGGLTVSGCLSSGRHGRSSAGPDEA